jgi:hypothetical protein
VLTAVRLTRIDRRRRIVNVTFAHTGRELPPEE